HSHSKYESNDPYQAEIHRVVQAESEQYSNLAPKIRHYVFYYYFDVSSVTLTVNTNLTTPLKPKSIKPCRLQSVPNNYTYIQKHNPPSGAVGLNGLEVSPLSHCISIFLKEISLNS
ncbi:hypothetical protein SFRURICE_000225, partial [Spodoptera frugiperda]